MITHTFVVVTRITSQRERDREIERERERDRERDRETEREREIFKPTLICMKKIVPGENLLKIGTNNSIIDFFILK